MEKNVDEKNFDKEEFLEDSRDACNIDWEASDSTIMEGFRYAEKLIDFLNVRHPLTVSRKELRDLLKNSMMRMLRKTGEYVCKRPI